MEHPALWNLGIYIACGGIAGSITTICVCIARLLDKHDRWNI